MAIFQLEKNYNCVMSLRIQPRAYGPTACVRYRVLVLPFILVLFTRTLCGGGGGKVAVLWFLTDLLLHRSLYWCLHDLSHHSPKVMHRSPSSFFKSNILSFYETTPHYFTQLFKYHGRRDSSDSFPLVRENSTSKEKEPR